MQSVFPCLRLIALTLVALSCRQAAAQSFGIELHNTLMPASGAMAGVSIARPQDLQSAINGNPATLTQFRGTQFSFGGAWVEPTYDVDHTGGVLPGIGAYNAKSGTPGSALGNIGVTQDLSALGMPATMGIGFVGNAGGGSEFRAEPASDGTSSQYTALDMIAGAGVDVTDRLSVGAAMVFGTSFFDSPFAGSSAMVTAYGLRGTVGANYQLPLETTIGCYWQTQKQFTFRDAISLVGFPFQDIKLSHPENFGLGIANTALCDGRLLLAMDVLFKQYSGAQLLGAIYRDQWVYQFGSQYRLGRLRFRLGYAYNENPMRSVAPASAGGITPGLRAVEYFQGQFAAISQHRITGGIGARDVLPGVDMDLFAGGMFPETQTFGGHTTSTVQSYWVGAGLTWRFGRGACCRLPVADQWGSGCGNWAPAQ
jgi:long-chain fatty acid transport protein